MKTKKIVTGAVIAALYTALCLALPALSYGTVQVRFSEALTLLPVLLPGGLMEIEGAREIRVNEETEYMVVRGMIRSKDVSADNSVLSTQIADASIEYYGKGVLSDKQKPGWFTRLMDNIWPF